MPHPTQQASQPAFPGAHDIARALLALHCYDASTLTEDVLNGLNLYTMEKAPLWLPCASQHPRLHANDATQNPADLQPPNDNHPYFSSTRYTGFEWANLFHGTVCRLSEPDNKSYPLQPSAVRNPNTPNIAHPCPTQWDNPWERLIARGGQKQPDDWNLCWRMVSMLEVDGFAGCIAADNSHEPLPDDIPYRRSELMCLVALVCRQVRQGLDNSRTTLGSRRSPKIYIAKRLDVPLDQATVAGGGEASYTRWLEIISWLSFQPSIAPPLRVSKQRHVSTSQHRGTLSDAFSERLFSGGSTSVGEGDDGLSTSPTSSTRSSILE
ncbi:hypothetical protein Ct61P_15219 [Colletotrichum tofieldiae]|nr:hypothetical protein Ct61P_15219 [Colletotrichum tofieldiae]